MFTPTQRSQLRPLLAAKEMWGAEPGHEECHTFAPSLFTKGSSTRIHQVLVERGPHGDPRWKGGVMIRIANPQRTILETQVRYPKPESTASLSHTRAHVEPGAGRQIDLERMVSK